MVRLGRCETLDPGEVSVAHAFTRVVRRCFLFGVDPASGKSSDYRKVWIEQYLQHFAACFGIDLLGLAILSNHFHLIPIKRAEIRKRLSDISWWMRLLCQQVATRSNQDDEETGRFFQDRFKAVKLVDEASLLACAAYVDLIPIRAAIAQTLETSDHTSVQSRIEAMISTRESLSEPLTRQQNVDPEIRQVASVPTNKIDADFLAPLTIDEAKDELGPCVSQTGKRASDKRASDKGFLPMTLVDYLQLLDWTAREMRPDQAGYTKRDVPTVIVRLGLEPTAWTELVRDFGKLFHCIAGHPDNVDPLRSSRTRRRFHLRRRVCELMPSVQ
jgi:REP element-mobilizing transposase RayT